VRKRGRKREKGEKEGDVERVQHLTYKNGELWALELTQSAEENSAEIAAEKEPPTTPNNPNNPCNAPRV